MNVRVRLFAVARQLAGAETISLELPSGSTVSDLREILAKTHPPLAPLLPHVLFAVDSDYVADAHVLSDVPEIACIPPVSGG